MHSVKYSFGHSFRQLLLNIVTIILLGLLWCINLLPLRVKLWLGKKFGKLLYHLPSGRAQITRTNLALCFPAVDEKAREQMVIEVFENFGAGIIETAMCWWDDMEKVHAITEIRGEEYMEKAKSGGRGVILVGAHFSTLDLSALLTAKYCPVYAIYREQTNRVLSSVMNRGRKRSLLGAIPHTSMLRAAKALREGEVVWYAPDQDMGEDHSVYAPFFGYPAATVTATAKLSRLTGSALVMMATYRKDDDSGYVVEYLPGDPAFPVEDDIANAAMVNQLLEEGIRRAPTQYYWFHRRFKSQPGKNKAELYR